MDRGKQMKETKELPFLGTGELPHPSQVCALSSKKRTVSQGDDHHTNHPASTTKQHNHNNKQQQPAHQDTRHSTNLPAFGEGN